MSLGKLIIIYLIHLLKWIFLSVLFLNQYYFLFLLILELRYLFPSHPQAKWLR